MADIRCAAPPAIAIKCLFCHRSVRSLLQYFASEESHREHPTHFLTHMNFYTDVPAVWRFGSDSFLFLTLGLSWKSLICALPFINYNGESEDVHWELGVHYLRDAAALQLTSLSSPEVCLPSLRHHLRTSTGIPKPLFCTVNITPSRISSRGGNFLPLEEFKSYCLWSG